MFEPIKSRFLPCSLEMNRGGLTSVRIGDTIFALGDIGTAAIHAVVEAIESGGILIGDNLKESFFGPLFSACGGKVPSLFASLLLEQFPPEVLDFSELFRDPTVKIPSASHFGAFVKPDCSRSESIGLLALLAAAALGGDYSEAPQGEAFFRPRGGFSGYPHIARILDSKALWQSLTEERIHSKPKTRATEHCPVTASIFCAITEPIANLRTDGFGGNWHRMKPETVANFPYVIGRQYVPGCRLRGYACFSTIGTGEPEVCLFEDEQDALRSVLNRLMSLRHHGRVYTDSPGGLRALVTWLAAALHQPVPHEIIGSRKWMRAIAPLPSWANIDVGMARYASMFGAGASRNFIMAPPSDFGQDNEILCQEAADWCLLALSYLYWTQPMQS